MPEADIMDDRKAAHAREAHHRGIRQAIEIDAPILPYECAPQHLRTYAKGTNTFKAPNPHPPRFRLSGRDDVVYPDDELTPKPSRSLKRNLSQHQTCTPQCASRIIYRDGSVDNAKQSAARIVPHAPLQIRPQTAVSSNHDRRWPDFHALCQPLTSQAGQLAERQQQQRITLGVPSPREHHSLLPNEQAVQQAQKLDHMQPSSSIVERGMSLFYGFVGYAIKNYSPLNLFRTQQPQPAATGVLLTSDGVELSHHDDAQAPKRRRVNADGGTDVAPVNDEDTVMADAQAETEDKQPEDKVDPMVLDKGEDKTDSQDIVDSELETPPPAEPINSPVIYPIPKKSYQERDTYRRKKSSAIGYNEAPEEWRNDVEATKQVYDESWEFYYTQERELLQIQVGHDPSVEEDQECRQKAFAALSRRRKPTSKGKSIYKNPREFFDHEREHSIPRVPATLHPNPKRIQEDTEARVAREEKQRQEEERRRREQADAQLKVLGLRTPVTPFISPLSSLWNSKLQAAMNNRFKPVKTCGPEVLDVGSNDFEQLIPPEIWLNDQCVQAAIQHAADWINKSAGVKLKKDTPKCVSLNTFFWKNLKDSGVGGKERMLKRVWGLTPQNFLDVDSIIIPINEGYHWTFALIRPQRREIAYVDSYQSRQPARITKILQFVAAFLKEAYISEEWQVISFDTPRQTNSTDCGVFLITNAILLALGINPNVYKAEQMTLQRRRIAAVILNGGFHGEFDLGNL